jgi:hypothetical protein
MKWFQRKKRVQPRSKRLLFVHVPRTGGSNLWYSCAYSWVDKNETINFLDLYHESLTRFGSINHASEVVSILADRFSASKIDMMIHHHNGFGIWRLLGADFDYCTLLRDPLERYISWYFHSLQRYYDVDWDSMNYRMKDEMRHTMGATSDVLQNMANHPKGPLPHIHSIAANLMPDEPGDSLLKMDSFGTFVQMETLGINLLSRESLAEYLSRVPALHDFYCRMFCIYFCAAREVPDSLLPPIAIEGKFVANLADIMRRHFNKIAFSMEEAMAYVEQYFGLKLVERNKMPYSARRTVLENIDALKASLRPFFARDYELLERLKSG